MKVKIDWKHILLFAFVAGGLVYITRHLLGMSYTASFFMSLGIFMLLLLGDRFAAMYDEKKRRERKRKEQEDKERWTK